MTNILPALKTRKLKAIKPPTKRLKIAVNEDELVECHKNTMKRLGLKKTVIEYVEECQQFLDGHQTDLYYTMHFIEERLESPTLSEATIKEKLEYAGFEENLAAKFEKFGDDIFFKQQTLSYWIKLYLEENWYNKTHTDPALIPGSSGWETVDINATNGKKRSIEVIQIEVQKYDDLLEQKKEVSRKLEELMGTEASQTIRTDNHWFHGTTFQSSENIKTGINLKKGKKSQDFSDGFGFYLSRNYKKPSLLAIQKSRVNSVNDDSTISCSALLIFEFSKDEYTGWDLDQHNDSTWENVIKYHRMGINPNWESQKTNLKTFFKENKPNPMDYIYGPVCDGKVCSDTSPMRFPHYDQLCILDDHMAEVVSNQLKGIIYIQIKNN